MWQRCSFRCAIGSSAGCKIRMTPNPPTKKLAFTWFTTACPKSRKLPPLLCTSRTIPRCLTSGLFKTEWRSKPTAKSSTAVRGWDCAEKKFPDPLSLVFAPDGLTCELGPSVGYSDGAERASTDALVATALLRVPCGGSCRRNGKDDLSCGALVA